MIVVSTLPPNDLDELTDDPRLPELKEFEMAIDPPSGSPNVIGKYTPSVGMPSKLDSKESSLLYESTSGSESDSNESEKLPSSPSSGRISEE